MLLSLLALPEAAVFAQNLGPDVVFLDSLVLEETGEHYIGNPLALYVASDGTLLVSDGFSDAVLRYDAAGRFLGQLGGKGGGPGEFKHLGGVGFAAQSVVGFLDETAKLELFDSATGNYVGSVKVDLNNRPSSFAVVGDSLWFAGMNPVSSAAFGTLAIADLVDAARVGSQTPPMVLGRGRMPLLYAESHGLARSLSHAFLDVRDRDVVLGFTGSPFFMRTDHRGEVADTVWFARGGRRGEPDEDELLEMIRRDEAESGEVLRSTIFDLFGTVSFVRALSRDDVGNVYTLHQDSDRDNEGTMTVVKLYAAVSSLDGIRQCADTLIPTSDVGLPIPLLQGRTLWILEQQIGDGAMPDIATVVRRFRIDAERCTGTVR